MPGSSGLPQGSNLMITRKTVLALAFFLAPATAALAVDPGPFKAEFKRHCTGDYLTYCGNLSPDGPEVQACFKQNSAKLSANCQATITAYQKATKNGRAEAAATPRR